MNARVLGGAALVLALGLVATLLLPPAIGHAWLAAAFFWSGVPVGSIGYLLMMRLVGGEWRAELAPACARGAASLPIVAAAVVPVLVAQARLYPWVATPPPGYEGAWLQPWAFVLRTVIWFAGLVAAFLALSRWRGGAVASIGLIFLVVMGSLIAVDWLLSLDPAVHSSGFGLQALEIQFTTALGAAMLRRPADGTAATGTVGALLLTLLLFWGYFAYLPLFILWSGNAPAETAWLGLRASDGWGVIGNVALVFETVPMLALLGASVRRSRTALRLCAAASLIGGGAASAWLVLPADGPARVLPLLAYLVALALIGAPVLLARTLR